MTRTDADRQFLSLLSIVARLRAPDGCPWDRAQTPRTIAPYLLEETHEALEAIEADDPAHLREELGDLFLEVALLCQMAQEAGQFSAADALEGICQKLIRRHPHVFGDEQGKDVDAVKADWSRLKAAEKPSRGAVEGVPRSLPALHRARRVSEKAAGVGFDWPSALHVLDKVEEEIRELRHALQTNDRENAAEELGDLLFALANLGRHLDVDPERSLHLTTEKFLARFAHVERALKARGKTPADATLEEMDALWEQAKYST